MSTPGRRRPSPCSTRRRPRTADRPDRAVQWAGRLLCWSLATAMATAATELLLQPSDEWWPLAWLLPWHLVPAAALTWSLLRAREKAGHQPPDDHNDLPAEEWDQAA